MSIQKTKRQITGAHWKHLVEDTQQVYRAVQKPDIKFKKTCFVFFFHFPCFSILVH